MKVALEVSFDEKKPLDMPEVLCDLEKEIIEGALLEGCGIKARAARMLSIHRTTLLDKMRKYDLLDNDSE